MPSCPTTVWPEEARLCSINVLVFARFMALLRSLLVTLAAVRENVFGKEGPQPHCQLHHKLRWSVKGPTEAQQRQPDYLCAGTDSRCAQLAASSGTLSRPAVLAHSIIELEPAPFLGSTSAVAAEIVLWFCLRLNELSEMRKFARMAAHQQFRAPYLPR